jgi:hypothetical protein
VVEEEKEDVTMLEKMREEVKVLDSSKNLKKQSER